MLLHLRTPNKASTNIYDLCTSIDEHLNFSDSYSEDICKVSAPKQFASLHQALKLISPKSEIQEYVQKLPGSRSRSISDIISYKNLNQLGPSQKLLFCVQCSVSLISYAGGRSVVKAIGEGSTRKQAEAEAARGMLAKKGSLLQICKILE